MGMCLLPERVSSFRLFYSRVVFEGREEEERGGSRG